MKPRPLFDQTVLADHQYEMQRLKRRLFLKSGLSVSALSLLAGCELTANAAVQRILTGMSRLNDAAQAALFRAGRLAPEYSLESITTPFPFNAYYTKSGVPTIDARSYRLELLGAIDNKQPWTLEDLAALPQTTQITRLVCVEGWSAIGQWGGVRFGDFLRRVGADTQARFVGCKCADDYHTSIDMATALHPQTLLALTFADRALPAEYGFPLRLRAATKLGFKNAKHITAIYVTNVYPGGYWEDRGYNWFGGL